MQNSPTLFKVVAHIVNSKWTVLMSAPASLDHAKEHGAGLYIHISVTRIFKFCLKGPSLEKC